MEEAKSLAARGMPQGRFQLVIDGTTEETLWGWRLLRRAGELHDGMMNWSRVRGVRPQAMESYGQYGRFGLPWHLPSDFSATIRGIIQGTSIIRLDGDVGELWDRDVLHHTTKAWNLGQWKKAWRKDVVGLTTSNAIDRAVQRALNSKYSVEPRGCKSTLKILRNGEVIQEAHHSCWWA